MDMREHYQDLIMEAEVSAMDYKSFLVRLLSVEEDGKVDVVLRSFAFFRLLIYEWHKTLVGP